MHTRKKAIRQLEEDEEWEEAQHLKEAKEEERNQKLEQNKMSREEADDWWADFCWGKEEQGIGGGEEVLRKRVCTEVSIGGGGKKEHL